MEVKNDNFDKEVMENEGPVIVDFWAPWCGPCQSFKPIFEAVSKDYEGKLKFAKLDTQDNPETAQKFGIRSIPCLIVFNKGQEVERIVGAFPEGPFRKKIDEILGNL